MVRLLVRTALANLRSRPLQTALVALILALGPLSGAHFNPVVTMAAGLGDDLAWADVPRHPCKRAQVACAEPRPRRLPRAPSD